MLPPRLPGGDLGGGVGSLGAGFLAAGGDFGFGGSGAGCLEAFWGAAAGFAGSLGTRMLGCLALLSFLLLRQGVMADLPQLAPGAIWIARNAGVVCQFLEQFKELHASILGDGAFEYGAKGRQVRLVDAQPFEGPAGGGIDRNCVTAQALAE